MKNLYLFLLFVTGISGAQIVDIPDANLKSRLILNGYDTNADGEIQLSEAQAVTGTMNLSQSFFTDITGVEAFTNVEYLYCEENSNITSISLSGMPNLKSFHCGDNLNLSSLTLNLPALDSLKCNNGVLTALSVVDLPALKFLNCKANHLANITWGNNLQLKTLYCGQNAGLANNLASIAPVPTLEKLDCNGNGWIPFNWTNMGLLKELNCGTSEMNTLIVPALPFLEKLYCSNSHLTSITIDPSVPLKELGLQGNFLETLDVSVFEDLEKLQVDGNHFTSVNFGTLNNLVYVSGGAGTLPTVDVSGLPNIKYLNFGSNQLASIDVSGLVHLEELYCGGPNLASMNIANTPALRILDCTGGQLTSIDLSGHANLEQLNCGGNPFGAIDLSPCPSLYALNCWQNNLTTLDISMLPQLHVLNCHDNELTTLDCSSNYNLTNIAMYANQIETLFIKNGSTEYFDPADFIENSTLAYICADDFQLPSLTALVGPSTVINSYCTIAPGDETNTITGTIRFDDNNNGCDAADVTPQFIKLDVAGPLGTGSVYTNASGQYVIYTGAGNTSVSVNLENPGYFDLVMPFGHNFPEADGSAYSQDICLAANGVHSDLEVVIAPIMPARPGFDAVYKIVYKNKGNQVMNGNPGVTFVFDGDRLSFVGADTEPVLNEAGLLAWSFSNLMPFESRSVLVTLHVNAPTHPTFPVNVNDVLDFDVMVSPAAGDETPDDNAYSYNQTVIGSYDPNDIYCIEGDVVSTDEIGKYLHYIINFENTGTDVAENIVVVDEIDLAKYDINSLRIINSSDDVNVAIEENKAKFFFGDIKLPIGGHGNILLKIKSKNTLAQGDSVVNAADIYFDYNWPVVTNDATTLFESLGVGDPHYDASVSIYPNPARHNINVRASGAIKSVQLYNVQGRLLQTKLMNETEATIDVSDKENGVYFLKITTDKGIKTEKIIKS